MKKVSILLSTVAVVVVTGLVFLPGVALTQEETMDIVCEQDVTVGAEDSLSSIAGEIYGDVLAFPAIVEATNAQAATDDSYATIDNPNVVEVGWKLCIPSAEDAEALLGETGREAVLSTTTTGGDRVGFPEGYRDNFQIFYEFDRTQNGTARVIYANDAAASVGSDQDFPYGSVLAMEVYSTQKDDDGNVLLDENGRFVRDELFGVFMMRKEPGYGTLYGDIRNGEWEYAAYRPDGSVFVATENSQACAACHVEAGAAKDWVFGINRFLGEEIPSVSENEVNVFDYKFEPETLTVPAGTEVTWVGNDVVFHTITAVDESFSGALRPGVTFSHTFEEPGVYEYYSAIYPNVKGRIEVTN